MRDDERRPDLDREGDEWRSEDRGVDWRRHRSYGYDDRYDERLGGRGWPSAGDQFAERERSAYERQTFDRGPERRFTTGYGYDDGSIGGENEGQGEGEGYGQQGGYGGYGQRGPGRSGYGQSQGYGSQYGQSGSQAGSGGQQPWQQERRMRGPHAGKGPQTFQRSDERIRELINEALTEHDEIDATHIDVAVKSGEVTLTGMVEDRRMKRLAEDCAERVVGVKDVLNQLKVVDRRERMEQDRKQRSS